MRGGERDAIADSVKERTGVTIQTAEVDADHIDETAALIRKIGATHICDSTSATFMEDLTQALVATGATDAEVAEWVTRQPGHKTAIEIIRWNNTLRDMRLSEMDDHAQEYLEEYIDLHLPSDKPVYRWFDVYDIEEKRL